MFQVDLEPRQQYAPAQRAAHSRRLADLFCEMLERSAAEEIYSYEAVPTVYALCWLPTSSVRMWVVPLSAGENSPPLTRALPWIDTDSRLRRA